MKESDRGGESRRGPVRKFNPGMLQSDAEIVKQFAVRSTELSILLDVLRGNLGRPSCQHVLVVAPRGRGKTMLLARAAAELRTNEEFAESLLPVRFMEESHEIVDMADFWLEAMFHLSREIAATCAELASELRATHATFCERWREQGLGDMARAAVLDAADRLGRRIVLMVENLQALSANADGDFGWQLRAVLQSEPRIMLLASATSRFEGLDDAGEPFFELFRIVDLKPLGTDHCRRLWGAAGGDPRSGRDIRPLEILTGGNPRLLVIVAGFSRHRSLRQLMEELVTLVDEHTEYFRGHLEVLPKLERRVFVAVTDLWRPSTAGEIAARARMDVRTVSTMLGRLTDRGAVVWSAGAHGLRRLYRAAEPLYSIYYKLRRERDEAAVVENLIVFMMGFYDLFTLFEVLDRLRAEAMESQPLHSGIQRALGRRPADLDPGSRKAWDKLDYVSERIQDNRYVDAMTRLQDETGAAFDAGNWARVIELVDRYVAEGWNRSPTANPDRETAWLSHMKVDAHFQLGEFAQVVAIGRDLFRWFRASRDGFLQYRSGMVLLRQAEAYTELGNFKGAASIARDLVSWFGQRDDPDFGTIVAYALLEQAVAERKMGRLDVAEELLDTVVARFGDSDVPAFSRPVVAALIEKADLVRRHRGDMQIAAALYDDAIARGLATDFEAIGSLLESVFLNRAFLRGGVDDFEGEIASYREFVDLFGDKEAFNVGVALALALGSLRQAEIGNPEEALRGSAAVESRLAGFTDGWASWIRGIALGARATLLTVHGETAAAVEMFRSALGEFPANNEMSMRSVTRLTLNLIAIGAPERYLTDVLASDAVKATTVAPLLAALRERAGEPVRVPEEVRSVAEDVRRRMEDRTDQGRLIAF